MPTTLAETASLAPLQRVMLADSLAAPACGHHIEQVEIQFSAGTKPDAIAAAWARTVAQTAALRTGVRVENGLPVALVPAATREPLEVLEPGPASLPAWTEDDRRRPVLVPGAVPWRAVYWPATDRFVWTFHHALLDGRSIARVLAGFFQRVAGETAPSLALAKWRPPSAAAIREAAPYFADLAEIVPTLPAATPGPPGRAIHLLGENFLGRLESAAGRAGVTAATAVTWAWGQALLRAVAGSSVLIEQVRCGPPQPGTAGFTMHTLPVGISRGEPTWENIRELRRRLLDLRRYEAVTAGDFAYGGFPDMGDPAISVIMVERGALPWQIGADTAARAGVERLSLRESDGQSLLATAHLAPALRLAVEGPCKHLLLASWIDVLREIVNP